MHVCPDCKKAGERYPEPPHGRSRFCEDHRRERDLHHRRHRSAVYRATQKDPTLTDDQKPKRPRYVPRPLDVISRESKSRRIEPPQADYLDELVDRVRRYKSVVDGALISRSNLDREALTDLSRTLEALLQELDLILWPGGMPEIRRPVR